ncbi:F-box/kelch-repeat protein At3g23880-like [Gastrolobium bilobum]|uniref:F-box/kelch-repeat protein At3g23880-like n=1 Tax=Gastrolobium bilobum TaxID=150636 RepID=UPI002AB1FC4A|nr:F-box/kelch-repeat protein At3g23880-like [Gastrolobium bilobum]
MSDHIPEAIVQDILHRLTLKDIVKCMSVCKTWNNMIKSHTYISSHLKRTLSSPTPPHFLLRHLLPSRKEHYSICSSSFDKIDNIQYSFPNEEILTLVGVINGVVCLSDDYYRLTDDIVLWNPLIQRHLRLPTPLITAETLGDDYIFKLGFGFDYVKNDFKVVRLCYTLREYAVPPTVELYSLNESAWRIIDASYLDVRVIGSIQCFFHGNVHWLAYEDTPKKFTKSSVQKCILMFNAVEERFNKMELPEEVTKSSMWWPDLVICVIDGCLSLIKYPKDSSPIFNLWMRKDSWSQVYAICLNEGFKSLWGIFSSQYPGRISHYDSHNEIMSLHSLDLKSQDKHTDIQYIVEEFCAYDYRESLVLLDKESSVAMLGQNEESSESLKMVGQKRRRESSVGPNPKSD